MGTVALKAFLNMHFQSLKSILDKPQTLSNLMRIISKKQLSQIFLTIVFTYLTCGGAGKSLTNLSGVFAYTAQEKNESSNDFKADKAYELTLAVVDTEASIGNHILAMCVEDATHLLFNILNLLSNNLLEGIDLMISFLRVG